MSDLLLTISLLCCGREKETVRCLDSLKPILEAVPSELILVDTGCSDEFRKKLREYTDQIIRFQWCNDFSAARNEGVKVARGQWFMTIDDDEWIPDSTELIAFFNEGRYREFTQANYLVKNFLDREFIRFTESWAARLFKLGEGVNYKGRIHEYPNALKGEVCYLNMKVHHTGYIYENEAQKMAHAKRNITSLLEALEEFPDNVRYKLQLIQEYHDIRDYEKMEEACSSALNYLKGLKKESYELGRIYLSAFHTGLILSEKCLGKTEEALSSFKNALADDRLIEVGKARIYSLGALLYKKQNDFDRAIE
ncbi:MAG: glycosyltransferase, partial [Pseudobutyrivibrio sp.]|nr:glycosyltransferase [Pseudobutyrivibrio sp.]